MTVDEQLKEALKSYLRAGASIGNLIQQLEGELERMKKKGVNQEFIDDKDAQIERLVEYHNQVEEIVGFYRLLTINYKIQLSEACQLIIKMAKDDIVQQEYLMKYLTQNPKTTNG